MEILTLYLKSLRNEEHIKFHNDVHGLITQYTPALLGIESKMIAYVDAIGIENKALNPVRASDVTEEVSDADFDRDGTHRGFVGTIRSALKHFDPNVAKAANRIYRLLDAAGDVTIKPYDQETAAINKLIEELEGAYAADVATVGVASWVQGLKAKNQAFDALLNQRYAEDKAKYYYDMQAARKQTDKAYRDVVKRIHALIEVNGEASYADFVTELNQRIESRIQVLATRKGRNAADTDTDDAADADKTPDPEA